MKIKNLTPLAMAIAALLLVHTGVARAQTVLQDASGAEGAFETAPVVDGQIVSPSYDATAYDTDVNYAPVTDVGYVRRYGGYYPPAYAVYRPYYRPYTAYRPYAYRPAWRGYYAPYAYPRAYRPYAPYAGGAPYYGYYW